MSWVEQTTRRPPQSGKSCPPPVRHRLPPQHGATPKSYRHRDTVQAGPHGMVRTHEEEYQEGHAPVRRGPSSFSAGMPKPNLQQLVKLHVMNPHNEFNQVEVKFPLSVIGSPTELAQAENGRRLKIDVWEAIKTAAKNQKLMCSGPDGCPVQLDPSCKKGFIFNICIYDFENQFPFPVAWRFPGTECAFETNPDGTSTGTFVLSANMPFCCDKRCVYEARHKEHTKKHLGKYGGYENAEELWAGAYNYGKIWHVPATCMGAAIVLDNLYDQASNPEGFQVGLEPAMVNTETKTVYYGWPRFVMDTVNQMYNTTVLPGVQGRLIDFACVKGYEIEAVRADAELKGQPARTWQDRAGTRWENNNAEGQEVFNAVLESRSQVVMRIGFTDKTRVEQICC